MSRKRVNVEAEFYPNCADDAAVGLSTAERVVILQRICEAKPRIEPFRSGGFMNKDYDMARISIDLPIVEAKKLMAALKAI